MTARRIALLSLALGAFAVGPALAQSPTQRAAPMHCAPRAEILKQLSSVYREGPVGFGFADNGALLEVVATNNGATWTVLVTRTNGITCVMLSGQDWQSQPPQTLAWLQSKRPAS